MLKSAVARRHCAPQDSTSIQRWPSVTCRPILVQIGLQSRSWRSRNNHFIGSSVDRRYMYLKAVGSQVSYRLLSTAPISTESMGNFSSCLVLRQRVTTGNKYAERSYYKSMPRNQNSRRPRREHCQEPRTRRMYSHHRHSSIRYVLVDIGGKDDYLSRKRRNESRAVYSRPHYDDCHQYVQLYSRTNKTDVTREEIEEQLLRNLAVARHNAKIASRPALPRPRRVHFGSVTNIC